MRSLAFFCLVPFMTLACQASLVENMEYQKAIQSLQEPEKRPAAEQILKKGGRQALDELLWFSRAIGKDFAIAVASKKVSCHLMGRFPSSGTFANSRPFLGERATELAMEIMADHPQLAQQVSKSTSGFDRAMAVLSQCGNTQELVALSRQLKNDPSPLVHTMLSAVLSNAQRNVKNREKLKKLQKLRDEIDIAQTWNTSDCAPSSSRVTSLVDKLQKGSFSSGGVQQGPDFLIYIDIKRSDGRFIRMSPTCAIAVYDAASNKDLFLSWLLEPILSLGIPQKQEFQKAIELLSRDIGKFPKKSRNLIIASIINVDGHAALPNEMPSDKLEAQNPEIIEALARLKDPIAQKLIEKYLLCSGEFVSDKDLIMAAGFLKSESISSKIYKIGKNCEDGLEPALIALLRASYKRAPALLSRVMEKDFLNDELVLALQNFPSPEICAELSKLAHMGLEHAVSILEKIGPTNCKTKQEARLKHKEEP